MVSVFDLMIDLIIRTDLFASYDEFHAVEMGVIIPFLSHFARRYNDKLPAIIFCCAVLTALGVIPIFSQNSVIESKPWYFLGGMLFSCTLLSLSFIYKEK